MSTKTTNYDLTLPEENEFYDVNIVNENNRKIDIGLQENKQAVINHENKTSKHLTSEQAEKIESALQPIQEYTEGNFVSVDKNGNIIDSGLSADDFENSDHNTKSVYSENGVHSIRYHDEKLQVFNGVQWTDITAKSTIQVQVAVDSGSTVTATDGIETLTETSVNGVATFSIPNYGDWIFSATLNGKTSKTTILTVDAVKLYTISLSFAEGTLNFVMNDGSSINNLTNKTLYYKEPNSSTFTKVNLSANQNQHAIKTRTSGDWQYYFEAVQFDETFTTDIKTITMSDYYIRIESTINAFANFNKVLLNDFNNNHQGSYECIITYSNSTTKTHNFTYSEIDTVNKDMVLLVDNLNISNITVNENKLYQYVANDTVIANNTNVGNQYISIDVTFPYIYEFRIDFATTDPEDRVTYLQDSTGMTAGSTDWDDTEIFKNITPYAISLDRNDIHMLSKNDFTYKYDGTLLSASLGSNWADNYDIMIRFPTLYYKIIYIESVVLVYLSDKSFYGSSQFSSRYIGAYLSFYRTQLRSRPSATPLYNSSITDLKTKLKSGDRLFHYYDLLMLQLLFIMRYKSTDSQSALGQGYINDTQVASTGTTIDKGMYYGSSSKTAQVKFAGIEDLWGNLYQYVDGLTAINGHYYIDGEIKTQFDTSKVGYFMQGGSSIIPFLPYKNSTTGSSTTGFCDKVNIVNGGNTEYYAHAGGYYAVNSAEAGLFCMYISNTIGFVSNTSGSRIARDI